MIALNALQSGLSLLKTHGIFFFLSGFISFLITYYLVPIVITLAQKYQILDLPDGKIKTHGTATPYLGGLAVFSGFLTAVVLLTAVDAQICFLLLGCTLLMLLGLIDDLLVVTPLIKFSGQLIVAISFVRAGLYLKESFFSEFWVIPLSLFWLLSCMNALNLIDVMDGLATTTSLTAAFGYFIFAVLNMNFATAHVLIIFMGALVAFLCYNKPQAKIYLGDAGSLFLGGFLGVMPLLLSWSDHVSWGFLLAPAPLAVPLLEGAGLILIRTYKGISFYHGSKDHFCHYLQRNGWSRVAILWFVAIYTLGTTLLALLAYLNILPFLLLLMCAILLILLWAMLLWKR